ncbi:MAG: Fic family protein [Patescibacteria group bacterium]
MLLGKMILQPKGFKAYVPEKFPPEGLVTLDNEMVKLLSQADLALGKLDGITQLLPDLDFFIFMYVRKEATLSSQIEGTGATMADAIKADVGVTENLPKDVDDILHYIQAMNYGLNRLQTLPLSLRLIREVHNVLLTNARSDHFAGPGEFRNSQNWIGGNSPATAKFVPPPVDDMKRGLDDLEKFIYKESDLPPLIKTALIHSQFETIHPFLDGNGRTGRLLVTFFLCQQGILEKPVLYLSEYFKKNRDIYFELLHSYHFSKNSIDVSRWIKFFLQGVCAVANDAITSSKQITNIQKSDMAKVSVFGRSSETGMKVLEQMYKLPIVNVRKIEEWTGLSRVAANRLINKFIKAGILHQQDQSVKYGRMFEHKEYLKIFN